MLVSASKKDSLILEGGVLERRVGGRGSLTPLLFHNLGLALDEESSRGCEPTLHYLQCAGGVNHQGGGLKG